MSSTSPQYPLARHLEHPTDAEIERVSQVLVTSFAGDLYLNILFGEQVPLAYYEFKATAKLASERGQIHVAMVGPDVEDIVGVAIWYPPGQSKSKAADGPDTSGWSEFMNMLVDEQRAWMNDTFTPSQKQFTKETLGEGFILNSWHLSRLGVLPEYQGKGLGKLMFQLVDKLASEEKKAIELKATNERNVNIYKRLGCEVRGKTTVSNKFGSSPVFILSKEFQ